MFKLIKLIFTNPVSKILFKIIASIASAIILVSSYLVFFGTKGKKESIDQQDSENDVLNPPSNGSE